MPSCEFNTRVMKLNPSISLLIDTKPPRITHIGKGVTLALAVLTGGVAAAENSADQKEPGWTLSIGGAFQHHGEPDTASPNNYQLSGDLGVGYFITPHLQFEGSLGANSSGGDDGFDNGSMNYLLATKYYLWPYKDFTPYFGIQAGAFTRFNPGSTRTDPAGGGMVGIQHFLSDSHQTSVFVEYNFLYSYRSAGRQDMYDNKVKIGLNFWFGRN